MTVKGVNCKRWHEPVRQRVVSPRAFGGPICEIPNAHRGPVDVVHSKQQSVAKRARPSLTSHYANGHFSYELTQRQAPRFERVLERSALGCQRHCDAEVASVRVSLRRDSDGGPLRFETSKTTVE